MRLEMERRLRIKTNKIFKEFDVDEDRIDESFGGRDAHKKKKVRVVRERIVDPRDQDLHPTGNLPSQAKAEKGLLGLMEIMEKGEADKERTKNTVSAERQKKEGRYLWYPEIGQHLIDASRGKNKDEEEKAYLEAKRTAIDELTARIPQIEEVLKEFKYQVYWAGKILSGYKEKTPFGDQVNATNFLRDTLKIDKSGTDRPLVEKREVSTVKQRELSSKAEEMSFEDKEKLLGEAGYGGTLFADYKRYVYLGIVPKDLDNVMTQVGKLLPFDVREFAEEWKRKIKKEMDNMFKAEPEAESWESKFKEDPLFQTLKQGADNEMWQKKVSEWDQMDERSRDNSLLIYRALMKIKGEGSMTPEAVRLWDSQKSRLEELGLML